MIDAHLPSPQKGGRHMEVFFQVGGVDYVLVVGLCLAPCEPGSSLAAPIYPEVDKLSSKTGATPT